MRIRHLQYFLVVAEEQSFARAAERVHIQPSPLSRAIKDLELELGVALFHRSKGRIRLTWPGEVFLEEARRILSFMNSVRARVTSADTGYRGHLRIALSDGLAQPRMTELLARCRAEEPLTEIRVLEMTVAEMIRALKFDQIDAGFTVHTGFAHERRIKETVWTDRLVFAMQARHPLLVRDKLSLSEVIQYPMIACHPERCAGGNDVINRWFRDAGLPEPTIAEYVSGHELMMMLVAAGYGIGLALESQVALYCHPGVVIRQILDDNAVAATFLVRPNRIPSPELERFFLRAKRVGETMM
ncbi:LysR family transcriptional regulator [Collimonas silvisoli]|uniref:LysR family transcriptional regulator n=1 Tax=Collimonas silvisoli TaxID=2825884 RepID=UPI001B8DA9EE|nr:LysR family transcriptional regulator [Collimonas silvisoli]